MEMAVGGGVAVRKYDKWANLESRNVLVLFDPSPHQRPPFSPDHSFYSLLLLQQLSKLNSCLPCKFNLLPFLPFFFPLFAKQPLSLSLSVVHVHDLLCHIGPTQLSQPQYRIMESSKLN